MRDIKVKHYWNRSVVAESWTDWFLIVVISAIVISIPAAWVTHFVWVIRKLAGDAGVTVGQMVLGALGAFVPPIGILHGYMIWLGVGFCTVEVA